MIVTVIEILLTALVLLGVVFEERLIEFEDKVEDKLARAISRVILKWRRTKYENH